jgi:hypothetical protein
MQSLTTRQFLEGMTLSKAVVDRFLDPQAHNWAAFDSELGYKLRDCAIKNGVDGSYTFYHFQPTGERKTINYSDQPCRINTYGDSIVECHQVSDGETWQEYLAAHLGEPVRNFGVGGYGIYQAYRRILVVENSPSSAEYLILNISPDDHYRNIYKWRMLHIPEFIEHYVAKTRQEACMFHANPWPHVRFNLEKGEFEEQDNPYPTPESLYQLCDPEHVYQAFKNDFEVQALLAEQGAEDANTVLIENIAQALNIEVDFKTPEEISHSAKTLLHEYALRASFFILAKISAFVKERNKKLLVLLTYSQSNLSHLLQRHPNPDQGLIDFLGESGFHFIDTFPIHKEDFNLCQLSPEEYTRRYYIGHYKPQGNHFVAFAIKDEVVEWLDPKPPAYQHRLPSERA